MAVERKDPQLDCGAHFARHFDVEQIVTRHGNALLAIARRHSANAADADDAYQRALEILLTKAPDGVTEEQLFAWLQTVVRNEALQIHRRQKNVVDGAFNEISEAWVREVALPDEALVDRERLTQGREALGRLKPEQTRCLLLRADGLDYPEICETTGFSYAKVNRLLSEGRKSFRARVERIDTGAECRSIEGLLSMIADGEAPATARAEADVHLKSCLHCQATLRDYSTAPSRVLSTLPLGFATLAGSDQDRLLQRVALHVESAYAWLQEKIAAHAPAITQGGEIAPAKKISVAIALSASIVAGGVTVEKVANEPTPAAPNSSAAIKSGDSRPFGVAPIDQPQPKKRTSRVNSNSGSNSRASEATTADVVGADAGTAANETETSAPAPAGSSVPDASVNQQPASAPGGSSSQSSELAP